MRENLARRPQMIILTNGRKAGKYRCIHGANESLKKITDTTI